MQSFEVPGAGGRLRYHDLSGQGRPLVFLHGLGCASSCDYPQVAAAPSLAGRRRILVDLLGSGFSDRPLSFGYCVADHARSVAALIRGLDPGTVDLFGHSMGGSVAIVAAGLLGDQLGRLVVSEPNMAPGGGAFSRMIAAMDEPDYVAHGHDAIVRSCREHGNDLWATSLALTAPHAAHRSARSLVEGSNPTWRDTLVALRGSRTVLFGEKSLPDPEVPLLARDGISVAIIPEVGHSMAWENPTAVAAAISDALAPV